MTSGIRHTVSPEAVPASASRCATPSWLAKKPPVHWPSATFIAPVSVATSTSTAGSSSATAYAIASAITSRPSASVLLTSEVRPPTWVITSPGRIEVPLIEFSAAGTSPMTRTGQSTSGSAAIAAITAAAPLMSRFMVSMLSAGLMSSPPLSKVMPLPTSTTVGIFRPAPRGV